MPPVLATAARRWGDSRLRAAIARALEELHLRVGSGLVSERGLLSLLADHPDLLTALRQASIEAEAHEHENGFRTGRNSD